MNGFPSILSLILSIAAFAVPYKHLTKRDWGNSILFAITANILGAILIFFSLTVTAFILLTVFFTFGAFMAGVIMILLYMIPTYLILGFEMFKSFRVKNKKMALKITIIITVVIIVGSKILTGMEVGGLYALI